MKRYTRADFGDSTSSEFETLVQTVNVLTALLQQEQNMAKKKPQAPRKKAPVEPMTQPENQPVPLSHRRKPKKK